MGLALDGLGVPENNAADPLESYPAVQLFVQRARQVQANFSLADNAEAVKTICQRVEGMPLGLELAASWLRAMSCEQIVAHIAGGLDFLTTPLRNIPERHRSLRAVFEQSWNLLSSAEKDALMRLAIFRGGFDLEAAVYVAGASLPLLAGLADKSLIRASPNGRCDLHELLRQYAADKLAEAGETIATSDRHLLYFVKLAEEAEAHFWGREQQGWYNRLEIELDNLRAALTWSLEGEEAELGLRLSAAMGWLFVERSRPNEGLIWLEQMLAANEDTPPSLRAKALNRAGEIAGLVSDNQRIHALGEQALALARANNDRWNIAWALSNLGYYPYLKRHPDPMALPLLEQSIALFRELEDAMGLNHTLRRYAQMLIEQGNYAAARPPLEEALIGAHEVDDRNAVAQTRLSMGDIFWLKDHDFAQAAKEYESSLSLFRELRNQLGIIYALMSLGALEQVMGSLAHAQTLYKEALVLLREFAPNSNPRDYLVVAMASLARAQSKLERAARLFGAAEEIDQNGYWAHPMMAIFRHDMEVMHAEMGEAAFAEAWAAGKAMPRDQVLAYALQSDDQVVETQPAAPRTTTQPLIDALTERELEILRSVAAGHSNRQIAAEFVLALGTVKWYLNTINSKLGVSSRTQAAARARDLGLLS